MGRGLPGFDPGVVLGAGTPRTGGWDAQDFQLGPKGKPRKRHGGGHSIGGQHGRNPEPLSGGGGNALLPFPEPAVLTSNFRGPVEQIRGHADFVVELGEMEAELGKVGGDIAQAAREQGAFGDGGLEKGQAEALQHGGEQDCFAGLEQLRHRRCATVGAGEHAEAERPARLLGRPAERLGIGSFVGGADAAGGDEMGLGSQPPRQEQGFGEVLSSEQPAGNDPCRAVDLALFAQPPAGEAGWCGGRADVPAHGVGQPAGAGAEVSAEGGGVGGIDGEVSDVGAVGEEDARRVGEGTDTGPVHFGPSGPAVVEPPIVVMKEEEDLAMRADSLEFVGEKGVAAEGEVMGPDGGDRGAGGVEGVFEGLADAGSERAVGGVLLGPVAEAGVDVEARRARAGDGRETSGPIGIRGFATDEQDVGECGAEGLEEWRQGGFDDSPDAAGAVVAVDDAQGHRAGFRGGRTGFIGVRGSEPSVACASSLCID